MAKASTFTTVFLALLIATACASPPAPTPAVQVAISTATASPAASPSPAACSLQPIVAPTRPAETPRYLQLDPSAGLHMTGSPQEIDVASYRLKVTGKVDRPLSLTYDDLRCMPKLQSSAPLICPGYFEDGATWAGASLRSVLELAGVQAGAASISLVSEDGYSAAVPLQLARSGDNFLAYEFQGRPVPILHGFPVRAVFPSLEGSKWVKWLVEIQVQ